MCFSFCIYKNITFISLNHQHSPYVCKYIEWSLQGWLPSFHLHQYLIQSCSDLKTLSHAVNPIFRLQRMMKTNQVIAMSANHCSSYYLNNLRESTTICASSKLGFNYLIESYRAHFPMPVWMFPTIHRNFILCFECLRLIANRWLELNALSWWHRAAQKNCHHWFLVLAATCSSWVPLRLKSTHRL